MHTDFWDGKHKALTERIIKTFYRVYNKLGYGFLEKIYENAMIIELRRRGFQLKHNLQLRWFMKIRT